MNTSAHIIWSQKSEWFSLFGLRFDVAKAKEFLRAKPHLLFELAVDEVKSSLSEVGSPLPVAKCGILRLGTLVDWTRALNDASIDLNVPLIFAQVKGCNVLIDGAHRVAKAVLTQARFLPCVLLNKKESQSILNLCDKEFVHAHRNNTRPSRKKTRTATRVARE
jgi:hypothetical protein